MSLIQIYQPADLSGMLADQVVTINPAHVRAVRLSVSHGENKRGTACFVFSESHVEYVHFPAHNYSDVLEMIREEFRQ